MWACCRAALVGTRHMRAAMHDEACGTGGRGTKKTAQRQTEQTDGRVGNRLVAMRLASGADSEDRTVFCP